MKTQSIFCALFLIAPFSAQAVPAFPGAEGGGAQSVGGRGGVVCEVTNLNDSGPGSFRHCVEKMSGPRTVVFRVSGNIKTLSKIVVFNPYLTIAGQTAPGGGIVLSAKDNTGSIMQINVGDVIIRYLRFRKGRHVNMEPGGSNLIHYKGDNIIIDHCTFTWGQERLIATNGNPIPNAPRNFTVSNSIMAEILESIGGSATGVFVAAHDNKAGNAMTDFDFHHNLFSTNIRRFPLIKNKSMRIVNNIIYNWRYYATETSGGVHADFIGNKYKIGPMHGTGTYVRKHEINVSPNAVTNSASGDTSIYAQGNVGPNNPDPNGDTWKMVGQLKSESSTELGLLAVQYRRANPLPELPFPITTYPVDQLDDLLLPHVGASHRLDCMGNWVYNRDAADERIINNYKTGAGIIPNHEDEVGGYPTLAAGTPCTDTDHDGIPDAWEDANGLDKNNPADGRAIHSSGYSNLERYLNGRTASGTSVPENLRIIK